MTAEKWITPALIAGLLSLTLARDGGARGRAPEPDQAPPSGQAPAEAPPAPPATITAPADVETPGEDPGNTQTPEGSRDTSAGPNDEPKSADDAPPPPPAH